MPLDAARKWPWLIAALVVGGAIAGYLAWRSRAATDTRLLVDSRAPHDKLVPRNLRVDELALLDAQHHARIYAVADTPQGYHESVAPIVLIHGLGGSPMELATIASGLLSNDRQLYVVAYDSWHRRATDNARDLAAELAELSQNAAGKPLLLVGHSLGGIIARAALNRLILDERNVLGRFARVKLIAVDSPFGGFPGPGDSGNERRIAEVARRFIPAGMEDMRAESEFFLGSPQSADPAERAGLYGVKWPASVQFQMVLAADGDAGGDFERGPLRGLLPLIAAQIQNPAISLSPAPSPALANFTRALAASMDYEEFAARVRQARIGSPTDSQSLLSALHQAFHRFPGDHDTVLSATGSNSLAHWLTGEVARFEQ